MKAKIIPIGLLLVFAAAGFSSPVFASEVAEVGLVFGAAEITEAVTGVSRPAVTGETLKAGDVISVGGKGLVVVENVDGNIRVRATGGSSLKYEGSSPEGVNLYEVEDGLIWFKVTPGTKLDVTTQNLVASVRGTEFGVMVSDGISSLAVLSGSVETRDSMGRSTLQEPGTSVSVSTGDIQIEEKIEGPRRDKEQEARGQDSEDEGAPGKSGDAPGKSGDAPGKSGDAPGKSGDAPGKSGDAPGKSGDAPGHSGGSPGKSGSAPGKNK